jgi:hypothetical protein
VAKLVKLLKELQEDKWSKSTVSLYVAKRTLKNKVAKYEVFQVNVDKSLRKKLRTLSIKRLKLANVATEYDFNTADLDNDMLSIETTDTDFQTILEQITSDKDPVFIKDFSELVDTWVYVARFELKGEVPLYSVRKVSDVWSTKKVNQLVNALFQGNMLVDLKQEHIFRIDGKIDFFSHDGTIFIADKKNFESALNFRVGMEKNRDEIIEEFKDTNLFVDAEEISKLVGSNLKRLRKLSQVKKAGYYKDKGFLTKLKQVSKDEGWGVKYSADGKLIVDKDDIDIVLKVLNND